MEIIVKLDEAAIELAVKDAIRSQVTRMAVTAAKDMIALDASKIYAVVKKHLDEHLTQEKLASFIDKAVIDTLKDKIDEL